MSEIKKKQVFVYREIRKKYIDVFGNFNLLKYCIYDLIRRRRKQDTLTFEGNYKSLANWLGISKGSVTGHIQSLIEDNLIEKNEFGLILMNNDIEVHIDNEVKGSFVILDFNIKENLQKDFGKITLQQFAVLSFILSTQITGHRISTINSASRLLIISKGVVSNTFKELTRKKILEKGKIPENLIFKYFIHLVNQIESGKKNKYYKIKKVNEKNNRKYRGTYPFANSDYDTL